MLEAVLKRIKYVKERSHPAKNWMAFIVVFFCYLVFCIFGDWRVCVLCVFCVAVFLTVFSVHVPVHEISMMMSIALRFIPILIEETDKIMKAQMARGADFESGNLVQRAKSMIPILVPLFVSAFRRATDLAMAMEARCYRGGSGRTKMKPLHYEARDRVTYLILLVYLGIVIALRILF